MTATRRSSNGMAKDEVAASLPTQGSDDHQGDSEEENGGCDEQPKRRSPRVKTNSTADGSVVAESVESTAATSKRKREADGSQENNTNQKVSPGNEIESKREGLRKSARTRNVLPAVSYNSSDLSLSDLDTKPSAKKAKGKSSNTRNNVSNQRVLQQVAPIYDMEQMIADVEKEQADILVCEEPLEPSKEPLVTGDQALFNRRWERLFRELLVFKKVYGHTIVPKMHMENRSLAVFVGNQRKYKKKRDRGEENPLTDSRLKRLEAIGFVWDAKKHKDFWNIQANCDQAMELWEENFQMLIRYRDQIGDCLVPKVFPANQQLARWVGRQRQHYRFLKEGKYSSLTEEKVKRLEDIGFVFDTRNRAMRRRNLYMRYAGRWDEYYNRLLEYRDKYGNSSVPRRWKADQSLASWVQRQRHEYKLKRAGKYNHLTEYRMKKLESVDFEFVKGPQKEIRGVEEDEIQDVFDVDEEALKQKRMLQGIRYESDSVSDESNSGSIPKNRRASSRGSRSKGSKDEDGNEDTETDTDDENVDEDDNEEEETTEEIDAEESNDDGDEDGENASGDEDDDRDEDSTTATGKGKTTPQKIGKLRGPGNDFKAKRLRARVSSVAGATSKARQQRPLPIRHRLIRGAANSDKDSNLERTADSESVIAAEDGKIGHSDGRNQNQFEDETENIMEKKLMEKVDEEDCTENSMQFSDELKIEAAPSPGFFGELAKMSAKPAMDASGDETSQHRQSKPMETVEENEEGEFLSERLGPSVHGTPKRAEAWQCPHCGHDEFACYIEACFHEAHCAKFKETGTLII